MKACAEILLKREEVLMKVTTPLSPFLILHLNDAGECEGPGRERNVEGEVSGEHDKRGSLSVELVCVL